MDKKQYGWAICMACALLLFCTAGLAQTGFSAYQPYLTRIGGLTNTRHWTFKSCLACLAWREQAGDTKVEVKSSPAGGFTLQASPLGRVFGAGFFSAAFSELRRLRMRAGCALMGGMPSPCLIGAGPD